MNSIYKFMRRHPLISEWMAANAVVIPIVGTVSCVSAIVFKQAVKSGYIEHTRRPYTSVRRMVNDASIGRLALLAIPVIGPLSYFVYLLAEQCLCKPVEREDAHNLWRETLEKKERLFRRYIESKSDWNTPGGLSIKFNDICRLLLSAFPRGLQTPYPPEDETRARLDKSFEDDEVIAIMEDLQKTYDQLILDFTENFTSIYETLKQEGHDTEKLSAAILKFKQFRFDSMRNYDEAVKIYVSLWPLYREHSNIFLTSSL